MSVLDRPVLICRFLVNTTGTADLARDNSIGCRPATRYLCEGLNVLATQAPGLQLALLATHAARRSHVNLDGTSSPPTASAFPARTPAADGAHDGSIYGGRANTTAHGGNV